MENIQKSMNRRVDLKVGNHLWKLGERTYVMGILNVTPDSFSDGGNFVDTEKALYHAKRMVEEGADIIDVGGESTRPGAQEVLEEEELQRVVPIVEKLVKETDIPVSVDTYKAEVAEKVLAAGAHMINDVWGLQKDPKMASVVAKYNVPVVVMHNKENNHYEKDMVEEVKEFLTQSIKIALDAGIKKENIILDPGVGFGKNPDQNIVLMGRLGELNELGYPILLGTSRKSMIGKILDLPPQERVEGTVATSVMGVMQGMDIIRVHDVKENKRAVKVTDAIVRR